MPYDPKIRAPYDSYEHRFDAMEMRREENCERFLRKAGAKKHKRGWYQDGVFLAETARDSWRVLKGGG